MHDLDFLSTSLTTSGLIQFAPLLGYVGLGPGPEFIPYFLALLGVVGAAFIALIQWPLLTLRAYLKGKRRDPDAVPIETQGDANHNPTGS